MQFLAVFKIFSLQSSIVLYIRTGPARQKVLILRWLPDAERTKASEAIQAGQRLRVYTE